MNCACNVQSGLPGAGIKKAGAVAPASLSGDYGTVYVTINLGVVRTMSAVELPFVVVSLN